MNRDELNKLFDEHFIDECDEVYDAQNEIVEYAEKAVKLFAISAVIQRSEQLFAFLEYCDSAGWIKNVDKKRIIEDYEKANNCV